MQTVAVKNNFEEPKAKLLELSRWKENNVYTEVEYKNQNYISLRWVNTRSNQG